MTTATSTKGRTVGIAFQSSLTNQPSSFDEIRTHEAVTIPTDESLSEAQPNMGHENAYDWSDKPIVYEGVRENGMTIPVAFRRGATGGTPPITSFAESGGCNTALNPDADVIAAYTDESHFQSTVATFNDAYGQAYLVELDSGLYYPMLAASYTDSTKDIVAAMALPSAASATNAIEQMHNTYPQTGQVDPSVLMSVKVNTRGTHTTSEDLAWTMYGCALGSFGDLVIEPQGQLTMSPTFHVADVEQSADALAGETFLDTTYLQRNQGNFTFEFANASSAGAIAHANMCLLKATVTLGHTTSAIPGDGCTDTLNSIQGYMASTPEQPKVVLELLMDKSYWDTFVTEGNTSKYIGFVWPTTSLNIPAYAIWMPNCHQIASPVADFASEQYIKCTVTYGADAAGYGTDTSNNAQGMSPWYMAISGVAS